MDMPETLRAVLTAQNPVQKKGLVENLSLCTMLFNTEMLKVYNEHFYGDVAEKGLQDYFAEEGLTGAKHPLRHCAVFRGDVQPQYAMQLGPMAGLPPVEMFAYAFVGAPGHDWSLLQNVNWLTHTLAEFCFNAYPTNGWTALVPSLTPKGYYSATGRFIEV